MIGYKQYQMHPERYKIGFWGYVVIGCYLILYGVMELWRKFEDRWRLWWLRR